MRTIVTAEQEGLSIATGTGVRVKLPNEGSYMAGNSVLVSFAILNTNWVERGRSYIDNFLPLVAYCMAGSSHPEVSVPELKSGLEAEFGLSLPHYAIQTIVRRSLREGLVSRKHGVLVRTAAVDAAKDNLDTVRRSARRDYEALIDLFVNFSRDHHGVEVDREKADSALIEYLGERSLPVVRLLLEGHDLPRPGERDPKSDFLIADFITHVAASDPQGFLILETVVRGSILATAVYLPDPGSMGGRCRDLGVFLDTPFLLRALGYHGDAQEVASRELLDMLRALGARLVCFTQTLRELRGVFDACAASLRSPRQRAHVVMPMVDYCLRNGLGAGEVEVRAERIETSLLALGVSVAHPPPITTELSVDEAEFEDTLQGIVRYWRKEALVHDLNCLTAVYRLRRGRDQRNLESAVAIFVTTNSFLVRASRQFFEEQPSGYEVPICALEHELGTVIWLKTPLRAPDFPKKLILADAYAALDPGDAMWKKYMDSINRLDESGAISDEDYVTLRYTVEARRALMDKTLGDAEAYTVGSIEEILARARESASREMLEQLRATEARVRAAEKRGSQAEEAKITAEARAREERRLQVEKVEAVAERIARVASRVLFWGAASLGILAVILGLLPDLFDAAGRLVAVVAGLAVVAYVALGFFSVSIGLSLRSLTDRLETWFARYLKRRLTRWFVP